MIYLLSSLDLGLLTDGSFASITTIPIEEVLEGLRDKQVTNCLPNTPVGQAVAKALGIQPNPIPPDTSKLKLQEDRDFLLVPEVERGTLRVRRWLHFTFAFSADEVCDHFEEKHECECTCECGACRFCRCCLAREDDEEDGDDSGEDPVGESPQSSPRSKVRAA